MKKSTNSHNPYRLVLVASVALCLAPGVRADSGPAVQPVAAQTGLGTIKGERSNIRSRPSLTSEVVVQAHKGDTVEVLEHKTVTEREKPMDWLRVSLPAGAKCFVSAKHLTDGAANVDNLNVRCGPGTNYRDIGKLPKGTKVGVVEHKGEWVQIKPTPQCSGWIAAELVDVPMPTVLAPPVNTTEVVTPPVAAPMAPAVSVVNADPEVLVTYVVKDGYLHSVSEPNAPASYELRTAETDRLSLRIAYLETSETNLRKYQGRRVRVTGNQHWRRGERYPVIAIERIDIVW